MFLRAIIFIILFMYQPANSKELDNKAIFAGGCFWCMQVAFDAVDGVTKTTVGYSGGEKPNPTYQDIKDHIEVIEVEFDSKKTSYAKLLDTYWQNIDPFDARGQFADKGRQYQTYIFYLNDRQKQEAEKSLLALEAKFKGKKIATKILPATKFYRAENYHQEYYKTNEQHYNAYKYGSGRVDRLKEIWEKE